jgi:hypothetical protein
MVYATKAAEEVSWFQARPATSLRVLASVSSPSSAIIDVGGGAATLVAPTR